MAKKKKQYIDDLVEGPTGLRGDQAKLLKRVYGGMEVIELPADLLIHAKEEDAVGAVPNDLENCAFVHTLQRMYDARTLVFMASIAYVDLPDESGERKVNRCVISEKMKKAVSVYDESHGTIWTPGIYKLLAPKGARRLDSIRESSKVRREKQDVKEQKRKMEKHRRALIKSKAHTVKTKRRAFRSGIAGVLRSGSGLIQTKVVNEN